MLKKHYPQALTLRKGILIGGCIFIGLMMVIMVFNWNHLNQEKKATQQEESLSTLATTADKQWFIHAEQKPRAIVEVDKKPLNNVSEPVKKALNQATVSKVQLPDEKASFNAGNEVAARELDNERRETLSAMQAPITSNMLTPKSLDMPNHASTSLARGSERKGLTNDPNEQGEKRAFLQENATTPTHVAQLQDPITPYEIKAGTVIPGVMISGINSDLPGFITAQVRQSVYDTTSGRYLLLPQGSKLFGQYDSQVVYGQERVLVVWNQVTFPNGQTLDLAGMPGTDMSGYAGYTDRVNNHYFKLLGSVLLMSVMTTAAQESQPEDNNDNNNPNVSQTLAASVGVNMASTMNMMARKNLNIQPTLEIRPGYLFNIVVTKNLVFSESYRGESKGNSA